MPQPDRPFKVVIVGGSVTGLTLAHSLEKLGVEYTLLERRPAVAPQEGASIGILPNGARILDQLGAYDYIERTTAPLGTSSLFFPDGFVHPSRYHARFHECFGYPVAFMERQKLLESLYDALPDKSRVLTDQTVARIEQDLSPGGKEGVRVHTAGGGVFEADVVVGADGVHSSVREEMWRMASSIMPRAKTESTKKLTADYSCVFGMSRGVRELEIGQQAMHINDGWSMVVIPSKDDLVFWFIARKLDRTYGYEDAPRFTDKDAAAECERYLDVQIWHGLKFGDIWAKRSHASMTVLQEGVFEKWSCGRVVCIGDSIHKMTVNLGQGANCAMEDVAVLSNLLHERLGQKEKGKPSGQEVEALLRRFNKIHLPRVVEICGMAAMTARIHSRDGLVRKIIGRYGMPYLGFLFEARPFGMIAGAASLDFIPLPRSEFFGWEKYNLKNKKSSIRPWFVLSCLPFLLIMTWGYTTNSMSM